MSWLDKLIRFVTPEIAGVIMAVFVSIIRIIYDEREIRFVRILLESLLCGALSVTASYAIIATGLNENWSIFAGGMIGYLGGNGVRIIAYGAVRKKL